MARIRSIHPGFFTDEAVLELIKTHPEAVPLLLGLWCEADDRGTFEWKPLMLKARILPTASCEVGELLGYLSGLNFIRRFEIGGRQFGVVRNFAKYQRPRWLTEIHPSSEEARDYAGFINGERPPSPLGRPTKSPDGAVLSSPESGSPEPPPCGETENTEVLPKSAEVLRQEKEREKEKELESEKERPPSLRSGGARPPARGEPDASAGSRRPTRLGPGWEPDAEGWGFADCEIGREAAIRELAKFRDHWTAQPKNAVKLDWAATWRNWVRRSADDRPRSRAGPRRFETTPNVVNFRMAALREIYAEEKARRIEGGDV
jgi:hypothetical protein